MPSEIDRTDAKPGDVCEFEAPDTAGSRNDVDPGFHWVVLQRCGRRPLAVVGRSLLAAHNRCAGLPYWSELTIFETASGRFAASLRHVPAGPVPAPAGQIWSDAWLCATADDVRATFHAHDPLWALPPLAHRRAHALPDAPGIIAELPLFGDVATAERFHAAWSGLLAAVFGLSPPSARAA